MKEKYKTLLIEKIISLLKDYHSIYNIQSKNILFEKGIFSGITYSYNQSYYIIYFFKNENEIANYVFFEHKEIFSLLNSFNLLDLLFIWKKLF
jgi:hypothetical protein